MIGKLIIDDGDIIVVDGKKRYELIKGSLLALNDYTIKYNASIENIEVEYIINNNKAIILHIL